MYLLLFNINLLDFLSDLVGLRDYRRAAAFRLVTRFRADSRPYTRTR
jgi:hypothetical protein